LQFINKFNLTHDIKSARAHAATAALSRHRISSNSQGAEHCTTAHHYLHANLKLAHFPFLVVITGNSEGQLPRKRKKSVKINRINAAFVRFPGKEVCFEGQKKKFQATESCF